MFDEVNVDAYCKLLCEYTVLRQGAIIIRANYSYFRFSRVDGFQNFVSVQWFFEKTLKCNPTLLKWQHELAVNNQNIINVNLMLTERNVHIPV